MTIFTENSLWQDWVDYAHEKGPVDPDPDSCSVSVWSRSLGDITLAEAVALMDPSRDDQYRTALWIAVHALDEWPSSQRLPLLTVIAADPPRAAIVFEAAHAALTEPERRLLWDAVAVNMPVATSRLGRTLGEPKDA